ncbi:hypothetical protein D3C71_1875310 [compost metagenome]
MVTNEINKAVYVLEHKLGLNNFKVLDHITVRIYDGGISQRDLNKALVLADVEIESISKKQHTLEDYFLQLIGGEGVA